jgi:hypothetical protein
MALKRIWAHPVQRLKRVTVRWAADRQQKTWASLRILGLAHVLRAVLIKKRN